MMPFGGTLVAARIERIVGTESAAARSLLAPTGNSMAMPPEASRLQR
jgi:hypothetical protein